MKSVGWKLFGLMAVALTVVSTTSKSMKLVKDVDVVSVNIEALALIEDDVDILCSAKCNDGIGRCWLKSGGNFCVFSGSQEDHCTGYGCKLTDGTIYY